MLGDDPSTRASQPLPRTGGGSLSLLRMVFIDIGERHLKPVDSRQAHSREAA